MVKDSLLYCRIIFSLIKGRRHAVEGIQMVKRLQLFLLCMIVVLICFFASAISATEKKDGETLTVGVPANRCPIFYRNAKTNEITGIGIDLMRFAAAKAGYQVTFRFVEEKNLKDALDNKSYDLVMPFGSAVTGASGHPTIVSENLMQSPFTLVTEGKREVPPLNKLHVGMLRSQGGVAETVRQLYSGIRITLYETMDESVEALRTGKEDALLQNSYVWSYVLQKPSYADMVVQPESMFSMDFRAGTLDTPKGRAIIERLNAGIVALSDTHRRAVILDHTSRRLYKYDFSDYLYQYGLIILLVMLLFAALIVIGIQKQRALQLEQRRTEARREEERIISARLHAIAGNYLCIYVVEPETGHYREFGASSGYEADFAQAKEGVDFFGTARKASNIYNHPDDQKHFLSVFTKENVMADIERNGIFTLGYRVMVEGKPRYVQLKAAIVEEKEGPRLIVGVNDIDAQVRQENEYRRRIAQAQTEASIDALTGIKNRHAYSEAEERMNRQIGEQCQPPFSITILDVNDLKKVNDLYGHQAGDQRIRDASRIICDIFKRSPVFRLGGDEFAVISQGNDYRCIEELLGKVRDHNTEAVRTDGIILACGMSKFDNDACVASVFERADQSMYENKSQLKSGIF